MKVGSKRSANLHVSMSSQEENSSNSDESSFLSEADDLESFNSDNSGEESDLIGLQPYQFEPEYSTDEERVNEVNGKEQQHEQDDRMGNLDW